ncbi:hypothetical protein C1646_767952 [Rhizophagus diaphanus]|nr:hypothetical protein C1646_767952 [Rhizophagus diaphanus] [Rhizophagus sp. MUCL 43196]
MFKNKLKFACSVPNATLDNSYIYEKITEIHLKSLQDQLWSSRPLIKKLPYNRISHTRKNNYIFNMLLLYNDNNITFATLDKNTFSSIQGETVPIEDIVDNAYYSKHRNRLREKIFYF